MKIYVVMGNDFPEAIFSEKDAAERFCKRQPTLCGGSRVYWNVYDFTLDEHKQKESSK